MSDDSKTGDSEADNGKLRPVTRMMRKPRNLVLARSGTAVVYDAGYVAADAIAAQRAAGSDGTRFPLYLIARISTFDGDHWPAPQIEETLPGADYLTLQAAVFGDDKDPAGKDG